MNTLKFAIIHSLDRESGRDPFEIRYRSSVLNSADQYVQSLARQLVALIGKEGSAVTYGRFRSDRREGPFPDTVATLAASFVETDFIRMSRVAMQQLKDRADQQNFATGGFVCFLAYKAEDADFLVVAMIKERDGLALNEDFEPTVVSEVDLTKLHQAARINLERYLAVRQREVGESSEGHGDRNDGDEIEAPDNTYLSFINKNSRSEVATYFTEALGCERSLSSSKATTRVVSAVTKYVASIAETQHLQYKVRQDVISYLDEQPDGAIITLDRIARVVEHAVGVELSEHLLEMRSVLNGEQFRIPEEFKLHATSLRKYTELTARAPRWSLRFEVGALDRQNADITYDDEDQTLKLRNLPPDLVEKIERALADRERSSATASGEE